MKLLTSRRNWCVWYNELYHDLILEFLLSKASRLLVCLFAPILASLLNQVHRQAVDVAGLKATSIQNIITICTVLGFLAHGFVTDEFEVTVERLGVYLPVFIFI